MGLHQDIFTTTHFRPSDRHIWLNRVREANTTQWTNDVECESGASITQPVHRNNNNVTQCLALNMTSPEDEEYVLFAESCDEQMSFVCIQFKGYFSGILFRSILYYFKRIIFSVYDIWRVFIYRFSALKRGFELVVDLYPLIQTFKHAHLAVYLNWRRDSTAKGAKKNTSPNVIR